MGHRQITDSAAKIFCLQLRRLAFELASVLRVVADMNTRATGCLSLAAALACGLVAGDAAADQAPVKSRAPSAQGAVKRGGVPRAKRAIGRPGAAKSSAAPKLPVKATGGTPGTGLDPVLSASLSSSFAPPLLAVLEPEATRPAEPSVDLLPASSADTAPSSTSADADANTGATGAGATSSPKTLVLSDRLFADRTPEELFSSVLVPAARGVTLAQIQPDDGAPVVTLTVRPTKITRGSGLVAVGKF